MSTRRRARLAALLLLAIVMFEFEQVGHCRHKLESTLIKDCYGFRSFDAIYILVGRKFRCAGRCRTAPHQGQEITSPSTFAFFCTKIAAYETKSISPGSCTATTATYRSVHHCQPQPDRHQGRSCEICDSTEPDDESH